MNKTISDGVVQGILIAAIGFSAATVWKNFNDSTEELKIAKKQFDTQIQTNELLKGFNAEQKKTNESLLGISDKQKAEIKKLTDSIAYLNKKVEELSIKASVETDNTVTEKVSSVNDSIQASDVIRSQVQQQQQQQQQFQGQIQQQQQRQQQQQQAWH